MRIGVAGHPTPEEVAAVLAVLAAGPQAGTDGAYERWRRGRLAVLRGVPVRTGRGGGTRASRSR